LWTGPDAPAIEGESDRKEKADPMEPAVPPEKPSLAKLRRNAEELKRRLSDTDELAVNRRFIAGDNYGFNLAVNLAGGSFFTGYLLLLHADDSFLGLVTMASMLGNFLQLLAPILLNRFPRRRPILIGARAIYLLVNIVLIGGAQYLPGGNTPQLTFILAATFLMNSVAAFIQPGLLVWQIRSIPDTMRVRFFSFINLSVNIVIYVAILIGSRVVDVYKANGQEMLGLTILRVAAVVFAVLDLLSMTRIKEYPEPAASAGLKSMLAPLREPRYLATVAFTCLWSFGANISGPYFMAYMIQDVGVQYMYLNLAGALGVVVMLVTTPFWTRRIERMDLFRAFRLCMLLFSVQYFGLAMISKPLLFIFPIVVVYANVIITGMNIVMANMPFRNMPEHDRTTSFAFYATMNSVASLLGVLVGKEFVSRTAGLGVDILEMHFGNRQLVLVVTGAVLLVSALALHWKRKPAEALDASR
jgi:MFS family permease